MSWVFFQNKCIFTMYNFNSLCQITFVTSDLKPLHRFASNFVCMLQKFSPTKFVKIRVRYPF